MNRRLEIKYDFDLDLDTKNSLKLINDRLRDNALVLEFGPANGRFTKHLKENRHCIVDIVEYNPKSGKMAAQYARFALVGIDEGNIENYIWAERLSDEKYDFIIFADVLEHLYDPVEVLQRCKDFLKKDGVILLSVPNMANNNIILNLLRDEFEYTPTGLLDDTHIHFFTHKSLNRIAKNLSYGITYADYTLGRLGETEVKINLDECSFDCINAVSNHSAGNVYQLIYELSLVGENIASDVLCTHFSKLRTKHIPCGFYSINGKYLPDTVIECNNMNFFDETYSARFEIADLCKDGLFRFDPLEGRSCAIELLNFVSDCNNLSLKKCNAFFVDGKKYYFDTLDPIFEFAGDFSTTTYINLEYKIINFSTKDIVGRLQEKLQFHKEDNCKLRDELCTIKSSRGYRLLEIIRKLKNKMFHKSYAKK